MNINVRENLEKIIVSSCIHDEEYFSMTKENHIEAKDFKSNFCKRIFDIMDYHFQKDASLPSEKVISQEFLSNLYDFTQNVEEIQRYKSLYKGMIELRESDLSSFKIHLDNFVSIKKKTLLISILNDAKAKADSGDIEKVLDYVLDSYVKSFDTGESVNGINFYNLMRDNLQLYNPLREKTDFKGILSKTGIYRLDVEFLNGGVQEGNLAIIAGRPASGKTTLIKNIGLNNSRDGHQTLFISLEMSKEQIAQGYYSQIARVPYGKILANDLTNEEFTKLARATEDENNKLENYYIEEKDSLTISQLINMLIKYKKQYDLKVFLLDYIQQIRLPNGNPPANEQDYSVISELLRTIVKKLKLVGYICAQVNRDCEKRVDKHPIASDLRSSGKLEQDAAYILTTYREEMYDKETENPKIMDITVAKNRFGPTGVVQVLFEGEYQHIGGLKQDAPI